MGDAPSRSYQIGVHALITAYCRAGHVIGQWIDHTGNKYPIHCETCGQVYPTECWWETIVVDVVTGFFTPGGAFVVAPAVEGIPTDDQLVGE